MKKTVLITGGGSGIGRATAEKFLTEGWNAVLLGRRPEPLQRLAARFPGQAAPVSCDLKNPADIAKLAAGLLNPQKNARALTGDATAASDLARLLLQLGLPDSLYALVNNAGIFSREPTMESDDLQWQQQFETNLLGPVRLSRALVPLLLKTARGGVIVNVSSTLGLRPIAGSAAYSASKAALINWTQTLALELAPDRIRVNCVCPGIVDTDIHAFAAMPAEAARTTREAMSRAHPLGRMGRPEDVAHGIYHLICPGSEWMTGSILTVDGGISLT